jgi:serine/threonine-protein kinase
VRSTALLYACVAFTFAASAMKIVASRTRAPARLYLAAYVSYVFNLASLVCIGRGFGPLLFTPMLLAGYTFAYSMTYEGRFRAAIIATGTLGLLGATAADLAGLVAPSYAFHDGAMTILPRAVTFPQVPTLTALIVGCVFMMLVPGLLMGRIQSALRDAEQRSFLQAWQLEQLLPDEARAAGDDRGQSSQ